MKNIKIQNDVLSVFPSAQIIEKYSNYELFHAIINGVRMVFYVHTTKSTGNFHVRIRNGTPMKRKEFESLAVIFNKHLPTYCDYHVKNMGIVALRDEKILPEHKVFLSSSGTSFFDRKGNK